MIHIHFGFGQALRSAAVLALWNCLAASAATTNDWTNSLSGPWFSTTNWSAAALPSAAFDYTLLTNAGTKVVTIDSGTALTNLTVRRLHLAAPAGATNTLLLIDVPLGTPFTTKDPLLVDNRAVLQITNSALLAQSDIDQTNSEIALNSGSLTAEATFDINSGSFTVDSGAVDVTLGTTGIRIGRVNGQSATLTVNGGTVTADRYTLGSGSGAQAFLNVNNGTVLSLGDLSVAQVVNSTGAVTVASGNLIVTNGVAKVGDRSAADFTQGGGQTSFAFLSVGDTGLGAFRLNGGQMNILPRTTDDLFIVGNLENGEFSQSGGHAVVRAELHVADFPGVSGAMFLGGGQFFATNAITAIGRYGAGNLAVSNATAVFTNTSVGRHDTGTGVLTLQSNANVSFVGDLSVGRFIGAFGQVFVNGGLLDVTDDDLWVGRAGTGEVTVSDGVVRVKNLHVGQSDDGTNAPSGTLTLAGGTTFATSNLVIGTSLLATGQVAVTGGTLIVTNASSSAYLNVVEGGFALSQGTVETDRLVLTNGAGTFTLNNGTLRAKNMTVTNGQPFVVGDGANPATLLLQGGTFTFANGLVISPNATVTGCGTVVGPVTNNGTYSNPCAGVSINNLIRTGNSNTVFFTTLTSSNHVLEFKTNLASPSWIPILPGVIGNGGTMSAADPTATNAARFYRIHLQ